MIPDPVLVYCTKCGKQLIVVYRKQQNQPILTGYATQIIVMVDPCKCNEENKK